jgi:hypothetical protein
MQLYRFKKAVNGRCKRGLYLALGSMSGWIRIYKKNAIFSLKIRFPRRI